jgi:hypothetical protein
MRTTAVILAAVMTACSSTEPSHTDIRLDVHLDRAMVEWGDSVRVSLTLTNASSRTIEVWPATAYGLCLNAFEVFDTRNREVSIAEALCVLVDIAVPDPIDLAPGDHIAITDWWSPSESTLGGGPIAPGVYLVRGRAFADRSIAYSGRQSILVR